jgi:ubiquinone biosynthesis protein UbiJ
MLDRAALGFFNHLLAGESWARQRLKAFAGRYGRLEAGPFVIGFAVEGDGYLRAADAAPAADVSIHLPDDAPQRFLVDRASVFGAARITGSADFAEALGFVMRHLRWDVEADLAMLFGDIPARRLVAGGRAFVAGRAESLRRAGDNLRDWAAAAAGALLQRPALDGFTKEAARLRDDLDRVETRLRRLG